MRGWRRYGTTGAYFREASGIAGVFCLVGDSYSDKEHDESVSVAVSPRTSSVSNELSVFKDQREILLP